MPNSTPEPRGTLPPISKETRPLIPGAASTVTITPKLYDATEYEFYIPATIWSHSATRTFLERLRSLTGGATASKGGVGWWGQEQEEVHVYRLVVAKDVADPEQSRPAIREEVASLLARYAEWAESQQQTVMFTEKETRVSLLCLNAECK